jgi:hypothetical protein
MSPALSPIIDQCCKQCFQLLRAVRIDGPRIDALDLAARSGSAFLGNQNNQARKISSGRAAAEPGD